ncbi:recombinase family protein [Conexibacter woesei]|uniref:recombinase family protein n=1 Tax=Conexibacter woesei TaxID=191495 RepID=UPI00040654FA|nr:recombinase family protein [Conexibacter woesei]
MRAADLPQLVPALAYLGAPADRDPLVVAAAELQLDVIAVAGGDGDPDALALALDAVSDGPSSCLVVRRLGDLATASADLSAVLDRIDAAGIRLVALDVGLDTASTSGHLALRHQPRRRQAPWLQVVPSEPTPDAEPPAPETPPAVTNGEARPLDEARPVAEPPTPATPPTAVPPLAAVAPPAVVAVAVAPAPAPEPPPAAVIAEAPAPEPPRRGVVKRATSPVRAIGYASAAGSRDGAAAAMCAQRQAIEAHCGMCDEVDLLELVGDREHGRDRRALERPGLSHVLQRLARGEAACLVICGLDHLSRSVAELGQLLRWLDRLEIRLIALDLDLDTATASGRETTRALASVSQWERERISERTKAGLAAARAKRHSGTGEKARATAVLHQRIAAMRADGMTLQAIADVLNAEGVPTQRGGAKWRPSSVQSAAGYKRPQHARSASRLPDPQPV